jgi:hypothetical protein
MKQINYIPLYRWFAGLTTDDEVWNPTLFQESRAL